ncbi:MAG: hypothetical protein JRJ27_21870 [Deltaproteobacteria bacterium]|nr:hypothetical protein [Deltaproteobacteria bacterium]
MKTARLPQFETIIETTPSPDRFLICSCHSRWRQCFLAKPAPGPVRTEVRVTQLDYITANNQCLSDILIRGHLVSAESKQIEFPAHCKLLDSLRQLRRWTQMDVEFLAMLVLKNQMSSKVSFAGSVLTWMSLDLLQLA